ncbi:NADH-ubiquinone oxidoreductase assembly factor N7BML [Hypsizygus marmoreus]|uniref:NADH-ubiquinone oxidoreductase assembly factor N7BML n=1 Tax=Hypsizygus marmoreus TaxID=39966 RepID=A0A369KG84_HYPMA|nr:NADH-ubiquinone oxidoreductase assembly factor N7BML [Hypsizygus marmoreus]
MSFISRIIQRFRAPLRYVGRDLEGNRFYEHPSSSSDPRRTKRTVQYHKPDDMWKYIGGGKRIPVQWSAWLTHTRPNPPSLEELQTDMARQQRVTANVALIEARDRAELAERVRLEAPTPETTIRPDSDTTAEEPLQQQEEAPPDATSDTPSLTPEQRRQMEREKALPKMATSADPYEPQPWTPRARTRGG